MIFDFLKKYNKKKDKIRLAQIAFMNLQIPEEEKALYLQSLDILDDDWIDRVYSILLNFIKEKEIKELEDIQRNNFTVIKWLRKKEAEEKKKEINSFSFLMNNI